ncbi:MAG: Fur family transcriptional regulator [Kiritimatiellia bacterium]
MNRTRELTIEAFPAFCRERGLKCTAQRYAVFAAIRESTSHPSVDETWEIVRKKVPTITRESVYRILNEFSGIGLLSRMDALSAARYDTCLVPHAHFICEVCGGVTDYPLPGSFAVPDGMPSDCRHVELRVSGVCDACRRKNRAS